MAKPKFENKKLGIYREHKQFVVSSLWIAKMFDKKHREVLRAIRNLIKIGVKLHQSQYFIEHKYFDTYKREQVEYLLTEKGFTFLSMGFTGEKATKVKIRFIEAFDKLKNAVLEYTKARKSYKWTIPFDFDDMHNCIELQKVFQSGYILGVFKVDYSDLNMSFYSGLFDNKNFKKKDATPEQIKDMMEGQKKVIKDSKFIEVENKEEGKELIRAEGRLIKCWKEGDRRGIMKYTEIVTRKMTREPSKGFDKEKLQEIWD